MNIYVGNLSSEINEDDLRQAFEAFGQVATQQLGIEPSAQVSLESEQAGLPFPYRLP